MPKELDRCVKSVKAKIASGKIKTRKDKTPEETAYAICNASLKSEEAVRWLKDGELIYDLDPETFEIKESKAENIPGGAPVAQVWAYSNEQPIKPVHSHRHKHISDPAHLLEHEHEHEHVELHGDEESINHEHSHPDGLRVAESSIAETLTTSEMPATMMAGTSKMPIHKEPDADDMGGKSDNDADDEPAEEAKGMKPCPECKTMMKEEDMKCPRCGHMMKKESSNPPAANLVESKKIRTTFFSEAVPLSEATYDEITKQLEVTLIKPGWSENNRFYSKEVLADAIPVFEGSKCYLNHPTMTEEKERPERGVEHLLGWYEGVYQASDGKLRSKLELVNRRSTEEEILPLIRAAISRKPDLIGESINAAGITEVGEAEGRKGVIVTKIARAMGTDIVTTAAAGGRFERLMASGDEFTSTILKLMEYEEWRESRPDFVARIKNEMRTARKEELETEAVRESASLKEEMSKKEQELVDSSARLTAMQEETNRAKAELVDKEREYANRISGLIADKKLSESNLPKEWQEELKPTLIGKTDKEMDTLIEAERKKWFSVKEPIPVKNVGSDSNRDEYYVPPQVAVIAEALNVNPLNFPHENESPEAYAERIRKKRG